jgi:concanavalin A-like lectin/glucanase superfamily protein
MARLFDGTDDYVSFAIDLSGEGTISLSFWLWWDAWGTNDDMAAEYGPPDTDGWFWLDANHGSGSFNVRQRDDFTLSDTSFPRPSAAAWHQYVIVMRYGTGAGAITAYVDGTAQSMTDGQMNSLSGTRANLTLYLMSRGGTDLFGAGRMAEFAIFSGVLNSDAALSLARGVPSQRVRPDALRFYAPLYGTASPEPELSGRAITGTVGGAVQAGHPPVSPLMLDSLWTPAVVAAGGQTPPFANVTIRG